MPRKLIIAIAVLCVVAVLAGVGGLAGFFWYKERRVQQALSDGEAAFAKGQFAEARGKFASYLRVHRDDLDVLLKFADACAQIKENRPRMLHDIMISYNQAAQKRPGDTAMVERLIRHCARTRAWSDLEYYSGYYSKQYPAMELLRYEHAVALDQLNRSQEAITEFEALIKEGTSHADIYGRLARLLTDLGLGTRAVNVLEDALKAKPGDPGLLAQRALYRLTQNDLAGAQADVDQSLAADPSQGATLLIAARAALRQSQWPKAIEYAQRALEQGEDPQQAYVQLLSAYQEQSGYEAALEVMETMDPFVRLDSPDLLLVHHELLTASIQLDRAKEVRAEFLKAYPKNSQLGDYMQAREMLASGEPGPAAKKLNTVAESLPGFRQARYYLVVALLQSYQRERAKSALELLIRSNPGDVHAQELYEREFGGTRKSAMQAVSSAQDLLSNPDASAETLVSAADFLFTAQPPSGATGPTFDTVQSLLDKAVQRDPKYTKTYPLLADLYLRKGKPGEAKAVLERAEQQWGAIEGADMVRAWIALAEDNQQGALDAFQVQLSQHELSSNTVRRWANSFAARGHMDAALALLATGAKQLPPDKAEDLLADPVNLCIRFGDLDRAYSELQALEAQTAAAGGPPDSQILSAKEQLTQMLARSSTPRQTALAKTLVESLLQAAPNEKRYQLLQAEVQCRQTPPDFASSAAILGRLLQADANDVPVLQAEADLAMLQSDLSKALDFARRAAAAAPQDPVVNLGLARIQLSGKRFAEAQATLEHVLMLSPNDSQALELLFSAYMANGRLDQANSVLARMGQAASTDPGLAWRLSLLRGRLSAAKGENLGGVEEMLRGRYVNNPDDIEALRGLAEVVARQGRDAEAEQLLQGFADGHASSEEAWVMLGQYFLAKPTPENTGKASLAFTRALVLHPDYAPAMRGLMDLYVRTNSLAQVLQLCERYLSIHPSTPEILYKKAVLMVQVSHDREGALATIEQALALSREPEFLYFRGMLQLDFKRYPEALQDFQEAGKLRDVNSADLDMGLAEAYAGLNDGASAARYLDSAKRKLDNGAPGNKDRLERLQKGLTQEGEGE